jgi:hydroxycarboxylate dehydrogenase B
VCKMYRYQADELKQIATDIFEAAGSKPEEAGLVADHLIDANLAGHDSHGVMRISRYVASVRAGHLIPNKHMTIISDRGPAVLVDGGFGYGQVIGKEAMTLLASRMSTSGIAVVAIRNSGHLGRIGAWAEQVANAGYVSFHFVNTSGFGILVAPYGGKDRRLSANPIAAGAPVEGKPPIILDIATSVVAEGKIQVVRNKGEKLQPGQVLDGQGNPTIDPAAFYATPPGAILPVGGHKGSGLSIFCEILAGSLTGGFASNPDAPTAKRLVNNMVSIAFDPTAFAGSEFFRSDVRRLEDWVKASPPVEVGGKVMMPGEAELNVRRDRLENGIPIDERTLTQIREAAASVGLLISESKT